MDRVRKPNISETYSHCCVLKPLLQSTLGEFGVGIVGISTHIILSKMLTKHNVSEIGFYLRLQVKPTQLGPIDRASPYLRTPVSAPKLGI
jgi:hypothetical protein